MTTCANCSAALEPQWKFCIRCGTAVHRTMSGPSIPPAPAARPAHPAAEREADVIPSAIRPESDDEPTAPRRRVDIPLLLGIALGIAGIVLVGYMIVTLSGRS